MLFVIPATEVPAIEVEQLGHYLFFANKLFPLMSRHSVVFNILFLFTLGQITTLTDTVKKQGSRDWGRFDCRNIYHLDKRNKIFSGLIMLNPPIAESAAGNPGVRFVIE